MPFHWWRSNPPMHGYLITSPGTTAGSQPQAGVTLKEGWLRAAFPNQQSHPEKCHRAGGEESPSAPASAWGRSRTVLHLHLSSPFSKEISQHPEIAHVGVSLPCLIICNGLSSARWYLQMNQENYVLIKQANGKKLLLVLYYRLS